MKIGHTLERAREVYLSEARELARAARDSKLTPGKESVYAEKKRQATAGEGAYVEAEARRSGLNANKAAKKILAAATLSERALETIDDIELTAVQRIKQLGSINEISDLVKAMERELNP